MVRVPFEQRKRGSVRIALVNEDNALPEKRRRRRAGDPRLSPEGRELFRRMTTGDLVNEFQAALDSDLADDRLLGGQPDR
jgi:hypothetical protein